MHGGFLNLELTVNLDVLLLCHQPCCQHPRRKSAKPQGHNTKSSDSSPDFLEQVLSPLRMDSVFLGTHTKWQLSTSKEKFERDTQSISVSSRDSAEYPPVCSLGETTGSPAGRLGVSFLDHLSSHAQAVILQILQMILQMSHPVSPALPKQTHGLMCPAYPESRTMRCEPNTSPSCDIQNPS